MDWIVISDSPNPKVKELLKTGDLSMNDVHSADDAGTFMMGLYKRRVVYDVDAFREKILLSDIKYDDRIVELMRLSLSRMLERENRKPVYRIFLENTAGSLLEFTAILGRRAPFEYVTVKSPAFVYQQYKDQYLKKLGRPEEDKYITTDQNWAKKSGLVNNLDVGFLVPQRKR